MKSILLFASLAIAACLAFTAYAGWHVKQVVATAYVLAAKVFLKGFELAVHATADKAGGVVAFVQAKAFVLRIIKRDRPVVSTNWTLAPSI